MTTKISADEILDMLSGEFAEARLEFTDLERRKNYEDGPAGFPLWQALVYEANFAVDRYRPGEVLTDETHESLDELAVRMAEEVLPAVMEVAHAIMAKRVAAELGGRVYRPVAS